MIAAALFLSFAVLFVVGTPIAVALGLAGCLAIGLADLSLLSVPTNVYTGIAKYPLLAIPMFVLVGSIFDRSGVALRLVDFATVAGRPPARARWPPSPCWSAMVIGGISGSGPANAAAVGGAMMGALVARRLSARVLGQRDRCRGGDRHPDPAVDRVHHLHRAGAAGLGAGAVRRRHVPRHPRRPRHDGRRSSCCRASTVSASPRRTCRCRRSGAPSRGDLGPDGAGADPRRHARRLVHARPRRR